MDFLFILFLFYITICSTFPTIDPDQNNLIVEDNGKVENVNITIANDTDDRIGLIINRGHAHVHGPQGFSGSDSNIYGIQTGIRFPGNNYIPLFSQTGGQGSSYSSGPGAPTSWSNGNTQLGQGFTGGNVEAGFNGGQGVANTDSFIQEFEIPLDPFGTVLYNNLKDSNNKRKEAKATTTTVTVQPVKVV